jgi:nicotinamide mononucleotide adenylyltransferase
MKFAEYVKSQKRLDETAQSEGTRVVISPGRFNPPHLGHKLLIDTLKKLGRDLNATPVVIVVDSGKRDARNPLSGDIRKKYLSKMFPDVQLVTAHNPYDAVEQLHTAHNMIPVGGVTGSDRADSYKKMVGRIFGKDAEQQYHSEVLHRDPDAEGNVAGVSASKVREAALNNDVVKVRAMTGLNYDDATQLIEMIRSVS